MLGRIAERRGVEKKKMLLFPPLFFLLFTNLVQSIKLYLDKKRLRNKKVQT